MFITVKRHEREKQELIGAGNRLTDAVLKHLPDGLFLLDSKDRIQPQVSHSMATLFRRQDFANLSVEQLLAPLVTAKTLTMLRAHIAALLAAETRAAALESDLLQDVEVRLTNADGTHDTARYALDFSPADFPNEPRGWLVRVTDVTTRLQLTREVDDLRAQVETQGEVLRSLLQMGGARFGSFLQRTDASMKAINLVLKKPAREADAFRAKLEETLDEVDRVRREGAAFKLSGLEGAARRFEDALHELRSRSTLSGSDFLPLAVKLDQLFGQFALIRSMTALTGPVRDADPASPTARMTDHGTQIIEAPKFVVESKFAAENKSASAGPGAHRAALAGSLDNTLAALCEHVAQEYHKTVTLECTGLHLVPAQYQAAIKNVAIQLIRNAVMHGIETPAVRTAAGKPPNGKMQLEFRALADSSYELLFEDDGCGLDPDEVRATAIARGVLDGEAAARLRDREAIKLIFKSGFSTLPVVPGATPHGTGMSLVRRYIHEAGGKIALASLLGHETRFKVTLPVLAAADAQVA